VNDNPQHTREQLAAAYQFGIDTDQPCATCWHRREHTCVRLDIDISDPERSTCPAYLQRPSEEELRRKEQQAGRVMTFVLAQLSLPTLQAMHLDIRVARELVRDDHPRIQQEWREAWDEVLDSIQRFITWREEEQNQ
jgi:hypothetical protein